MSKTHDAAQNKTGRWRDRLEKEILSYACDDNVRG